MKRIDTFVSRAFVLSFAALAACSAAPDSDPGGESATKSGSRPIIGGTPATAYPEAALVNMKQGGQVTSACSGSIIAPKVVLTAGHCIHGFTGWDIVVPYANNQRVSSTSAKTFDWNNDGPYVDPNQHDVGLIFLTKEVTLPSYPKIATAPLSNGSKIVNIGRIRDGQFSSTDLFVSKPISITDGASQGFPFDYAASEVIQSGDSGGPDMLPGDAPHTIVAVNSGAGGGSEVLARVDLVATWIKEQIDLHGGGGGEPVDPGGDPGTDPGGDPGGDPGTDPGDPGCEPDPGGDPGGDPGSDPGADPGQGSCGGISYAGFCDGNVVIWCEEGGLKGIDCASFGQSCGWNSSNQFYDCL